MGKSLVIAVKSSTKRNNTTCSCTWAKRIYIWRLLSSCRAPLRRALLHRCFLFLVCTWLQPLYACWSSLAFPPCESSRGPRAVECVLDVLLWTGYSVRLYLVACNARIDSLRPTRRFLNTVWVFRALLWMKLLFVSLDLVARSARVNPLRRSRRRLVQKLWVFV